MKYWEIIADNLSKAGWSWGCVATVDSNGRTIFVADAHRGDGKRFVVRADEKLTPFVELEAATRQGVKFHLTPCIVLFAPVVQEKYLLQFNGPFFQGAQF